MPPAFLRLHPDAGKSQHVPDHAQFPTHKVDTADAFLRIIGMYCLVMEGLYADKCFTDAEVLGGLGTGI
jgi:hypothetical protein